MVISDLFGEYLALICVCSLLPIYNVHYKYLCMVYLCNMPTIQGRISYFTVIYLFLSIHIFLMMLSVSQIIASNGRMVSEWKAVVV